MARPQPAAAPVPVVPPEEAPRTDVLDLARTFHGDARPLDERKADLVEKLRAHAKLPATRRWPKGIDPVIGWGDKRIERWTAGDERPVRVVVMGMRVHASVNDRVGAVDGEVQRLERATGGGR